MKKAIVSFVLLIVLSCSDDVKSPIIIRNPGPDFVDQNVASIVGKNFLLVNHAAGGGPNGRAARSAQSLVEDKVTSIKDSTGLSSFYIIEYNGGGFIVVSADKKVYPVLAYSDESTFSLDKMPEGVAGVLNSYYKMIRDARSLNRPVNADVKREWDRFESTLDIDAEREKLALSKKSSAGRQNNEPPYDPGGCTGSYYEEVLLNFPMKWNQNCNWNISFPDKACTGLSCGKAYVGCVAVAMGQIMRFHQYPGGYSWGSMPATTSSTTTSNFLYAVAEAVNMDYDCDGSGASSNDVEDALEDNFGYSSSVARVQYNFNTVANELRAGRPVYISGGRRAGSWPVYWYADGHAWVAYGFKEQYFCETGYIYGSTYMNWGWGGAYDGWFGVFTPAGRDYTYQTQAVIGIKP